MMKTMNIAVILTFAAAAHTEPLPQPKPSGPGGSCPHGFFTSASYCVPSQGAQDAVPKAPNSTCPWGWTSSGSFCLRSGRDWATEPDQKLSDIPSASAPIGRGFSGNNSAAINNKPHSG
jgi:hypothetical protein